ncbi:hypothetical protein [Streptomyces sp. NPDC047974]|uniref:hypothetical protein n=1 Tax=Streptomyces sp. NPDC047974 TaxID=3154343 RepID=UPI0033F2E779
MRVVLASLEAAPPGAPFGAPRGAPPEVPPGAPPEVPLEVPLEAPLDAPLEVPPDARLEASRRTPATPRLLALLSDLIWAHAALGNGLEHVRAKASDDGAGVDLYLFLRAASEAAALDQARAILDGARAPLGLHGYRAAAPRR